MLVIHGAGKSTLTMDAINLAWIARAWLKSFRLVLVCLIALLASVVASPANPSGLIILYPDVRKPYSKIYADIITGIEESYTGETTTIAISKNDFLDHHREKVTQFDPNAIIALGKRSLSVAEQMNLGIPIIVGAITGSNSKVLGISMVPDPRIIIDKLLLLRSNVRNVYVVTNTQRQQSQLDSAMTYALTRDINIIVHNADTIQDAAGQYRKVLGDIDQNDAIWLMYDKALNDSAILSKVLETAWKKKFAVFSSNPTHVKRGALFAIYPDNKKLGASLGLLARDNESGKIMPGEISPLQDIYTIVNGRTGRHLGLNMSREMRRDIDSIL